jgi:hypothetical protein
MAKIVKASEPIEARAIKALIYGEPGIGKSTLGLSAPRPLLIDCDGGVRRVSPQFRKDYIPVESWDDILQVTKENLNEYDTFVVDTVGRALDFLTDHIIKENYKLQNGGALTLQGYGVLGNKFKAFLSSMNASGKNLIFIAHLKENVENDTRYFRPDIVGQSAGNIIRDMDLVGYMQSRSNERTISFDPTDNYYGKNACELPSIIKVPDLNKTPAAQPLTDIFETYHAKLASQTEVIKQYNQFVNEQKKKIAALKDVDQANEFIEAMLEAAPVWDSHVVIKKSLFDYTRDKGWKYDKELEAFVEIPPEKAKKDPHPMDEHK